MNRDPCRIGFVIVTHGALGEELLRVARYILGKGLENFRTVAVPFMGELQPPPAGVAPFADRRERIRTLLAAAMAEVDQGNGVMLLTDLVGGTSSNVAQEMTGGNRGAVVAGVNLPMLLKAASLDTASVADAVADLVRRSRNAIQPLPGKKA
ncbi:MAG: PTS fructose transporter subunit IIA [Thermodesulfobacteriota bacterium]